MRIDLNKTPFLFSAGSAFSYKINKIYYNDSHFVWCTVHFNRKGQPVTSNPFSICKRFIEQISTGDRHTEEISNNKAGVLKGAQKKLDEGTISEAQFIEICQLVNLSRYEDYFPVIYVIDGKKISDDRLLEVNTEDKASDSSSEYKIVDLKSNEFELIDLHKMFVDFIDVADKKAGE